MPHKTHKEVLKTYTERAVEATMNGTMIPALVYLPWRLRSRKVRVAETVTINPATEAETALRVANADPTGMLIAMMQGQPVPVFKLERRKDGKLEVTTDFECASLELRAQIALKLAARVPKSKDPEYDAMIAHAAEDKHD